ERELAGGERRGDQHVGGGEIRVDLAAAVTLAAVMTRGPAVQRARQDREPRGNARDAQLVRGLRDQQPVTARRGPPQVQAAPPASQPTLHASDSPNGRCVVDLPRRGASWGQVSIAESVGLSHGAPASSTITSAPAWVSA